MRLKWARVSCMVTPYTIEHSLCTEADDSEEKHAIDGLGNGVRLIYLLFAFNDDFVRG